MAKYIGTLKDEKGDSFYPHSANDHKQVGHKAEMFTDLFCENFAENDRSGCLAVKIGDANRKQQNFMITIKGHYFAYSQSTDWSATVYFYSSTSNFHDPVMTITNDAAIKRIRWATDSSNQVYLLFGDVNTYWGYSAIFVDKIYINWVIDGYQELWENWSTALYSDLSSFTTIKECVMRCTIPYPVGAIYLSTSSTSPATLFGGTWEQIKDRFLLAAGDSYSAGGVSGASSVTLGVANLPAHNHSASTNSTGGHAHGMAGWRLTTNSGSYQVRSREVITGDGWDWSRMSSEGAHSHTVTVNNTGSGTAFSIMPPYLTVYMWKRTG